MPHSSPQVIDLAPASRWVRSSDGIVAGVCAGLGERFGVEPWMLRAGWLIAVLAFGTGIVLYLILAYALPREDRLSQAQDKRFLGVCARLSRRTGAEVGIVRAIVVLSLLVSCGTTLLLYFILYFVVPDDQRRSALPSA